MKKFLSLLSLLTISGNVITITIAASYYEKQEIKLENIVDNKEFNTNNLENLNRVKRGNSANKKNNHQKENNCR